MAHATLRLSGGVIENETPTLNEVGISSCNLIRFQYDPKGASLPQKLGGWNRYFANTIYAKVRALWAWEDTVSYGHLAVGTENAPSTYRAQLSVITNGNQIDITPRSMSDNIAPDASATMGDSIVTVTDTTIQDITRYDTVYIPVHIAIGGLILFGLYACDPDGHLSSTSWTVNVTDILGNNVLATSSSTSPVVAEFTTVSGDSAVNVELPAHGYSVGSTYPVLVPTTVGGITFTGNYIVQSVVDADNFTITGTQQATASTSGFINDGNSRYEYGFGVGSIPAGTGYGIGPYGGGGYGTGTAVTPTTGTPISADSWFLDNWGSILLANPTVSPIVVNTVSASGDGTTGTIVFDIPYDIPVGQGIVVSGVTPSGWNGTYLVTAETSNSVSFLTAETAAITGQGAITVQDAPFQPIYQWDSESGAPKATIIPEAPPYNAGFFVAMPQRQIIAWGSTFTGVPDPLLIRWCDVNNFHVWTGSVINQAGSYRLPRGSRIVAGIQGPQQGLIWTDIAVWSAQYIGPPYVLSFNQLGAGCGLIGEKAVAVLSGIVYWMGPSQFYALTGDGVQPIPSPIWDIVFQNIDPETYHLIRAAPNSLFGEMAWYYASLSGNGEIDSYVKLNVLTGDWDYGLLSRSAWIDQSVLGPPIGADPQVLYLYQHETSPDADGQPLLASFRTGYFSIADGDMMAFVDQFWIDMKFGYFSQSASATVNVTFYGADYPGQTPRVYGPYALTQSSTYISPRIRARLVAIEMGSDDTGSFWRLGGNRFRVQSDGQF